METATQTALVLADQHNDPQDRAERRERTTLAFLVALQHLTPAQRAILLLREVLEWKASEVAEWLNLSVPAVTSALQRARHTLRHRNIESEERAALPSQELQTLLDRYVALWEQGDIPGLVALLREDAWFTMPPIPAWVQGRAAIATLLSTSLFANGSPAFGLYERRTGASSYQLVGLLVLGVVGEQIGSLVAFLELSSLSSFALLPTLASSSHSTTINSDGTVPSLSLTSGREIDR